MAKKSRQHVPRTDDLRVGHDPVIDLQQARRFPEFGPDELIQRRTALTNSVVIVQQLIEAMSQSPDSRAWGVAPSRLPIFLAHLTISFDALKHVAGLYNEDLTLIREQALTVVPTPGLIGLDGQPL